MSQRVCAYRTPYNLVKDIPYNYQGRGIGVNQFAQCIFTLFSLFGDVLFQLINLRATTYPLLGIETINKTVHAHLQQWIVIQPGPKSPVAAYVVLPFHCRVQLQFGATTEAVHRIFVYHSPVSALP